MRFGVENSLYEQCGWNNRVGIEEAENGLTVIWKARSREHAECRAGIREESQRPEQTSALGLLFFILSQQGPLCFEA